MRIERAGERDYEVVEGWGKLPDGWEWGRVAAVAVDSADNVHVFTRAAHPYLIFDRDGNLLDHWGAGLFKQAHGLCVGPDGSVYFVDVHAHIVTKFNAHGRHQLTLGTRDTPSDTGYTREIREPERDRTAADVPGGEFGSYTEATAMINGVAHAGPPFHQPTDVSIASNGDIYVSDGYRNARVHRFSPDGQLLQSWGQPGNAKDLRNTTDGPGIFHTPHGIWVHKDRVYASDRENNRIQVFTLDGDHIVTWPGYLRPTKIYIDPAEEVMYVSELDDRVTIADLAGNVIGHLGPGHVIGQIDGGRSHEPGKFYGPHGIWTDSEGAIYVGEVLEGKRLQKFARVK
jgi:DNA-binding beta-propeller fold protein YncE